MSPGFPPYLELRGMSRIEAGIYSGLPLFLGAFGCILGGRLSDLVVRRTGNTRNRRFIGFGGFAAGALVSARERLHARRQDDSTVHGHDLLFR